MVEHVENWIFFWFDKCFTLIAFPMGKYVP